MTKKHEKIFESYKRNHQGGDYFEKETAKVENDRRRLLRGKGQTVKMVEQFVRSHRDGSVNDESAAELDDLMAKEKRLKGAYRAHRDRLNELKKNDDFKQLTSQEHRTGRCGDWSWAVVGWRTDQRPQVDVAADWPNFYGTKPFTIIYNRYYCVFV